MNGTIKAIRLSAAAFWLLAGLAVLAGLRSDYLLWPVLLGSGSATDSADFSDWLMWLCAAPLLALDVAWRFAVVAVVCQLVGDVAVRLPLRLRLGR